MRFPWTFFRSTIPCCLVAILIGASSLFAFTAESPAAVAEGNPIIVGLNADLSADSAQAGEAIRRGMVLAMDEIDAAGGVQGRPLNRHSPPLRPASAVDLRLLGNPRFSVKIQEIAKNVRTSPVRVTTSLVDLLRCGQ